MSHDTASPRVCNHCGGQTCRVRCEYAAIPQDIARALRAERQAVMMDLNRRSAEMEALIARHPALAEGLRSAFRSYVAGEFARLDAKVRAAKSAARKVCSAASVVKWAAESTATTAKGRKNGKAVS